MEKQSKFDNKNNKIVEEKSAIRLLLILMIVKQREIKKEKSGNRTSLPGIQFRTRVSGRNRRRMGRIIILHVYSNEDESVLYKRVEWKEQIHDQQEETKKTKKEKKTSQNEKGQQRM